MIGEISHPSGAHDIYGYDKIRRLYPESSYICVPHLVIPSVSSSNIRNYKDPKRFALYTGWDLNDYCVTDGISMYIYCDNANSNMNVAKIERFIDLLTTLQPVVDPYFIYKGDVVPQSKFCDIEKAQYLLCERRTSF